MQTAYGRLLTRLQNKYWRLAQGRPPDVSQFSKDLTDDLKSTYEGGVAEAFFSSDREPAHKWLHYLPIYEKIFAPYVGSPVKFLEIGVSRGGSLRMWRKFLGDGAVLYGVDVEEKCAAQDGKFAAVRIGSQADPDFLKRVVAEMGGLDIVLDDGSHHASDQRTSFEVLFPLLSEGGVYVVEDLHTSYWPKSEGGLKRPGAAIEFPKDKIDVMHRHYVKSGLNTPASMPDIDNIQFFDSIAVVTKRKQSPRHHVIVPAPRDNSFSD